VTKCQWCYENNHIIGFRCCWVWRLVIQQMVQIFWGNRVNSTPSIEQSKQNPLCSSTTPETTHPTTKYKIPQDLIISNISVRTWCLACLTFTYHTFRNKIIHERIKKPVENQMSGHPSIMPKLTHPTVTNSKCPSSGWCGFIPGYLLF